MIVFRSSCALRKSRFSTVEISFGPRSSLLKERLLRLSLSLSLTKKTILLERDRWSDLKGLREKRTSFPLVDATRVTYPAEIRTIDYLRNFAQLQVRTKETQLGVRSQVQLYARSVETAIDRSHPQDSSNVGVDARRIKNSLNTLVADDKRTLGRVRRARQIRVISSDELILRWESGRSLPLRRDQFFLRPGMNFSAHCPLRPALYPR